MNDKISVFGSTGFIGSAFCNSYKEQVIRIPREQLNAESNEILYLISTTHNYNHPQLDVNTNLTHLIKVLDKCKSDMTFTYASSWFVYADVPLPAKEEYVGNPAGYYSITKLAAERIVETYCKINNIPYRILRLCNVYGKGDMTVSKKKNALQHLITEIQNEKPVNLYYDGNFIRDYMHVDDVCRAIHLCITKSEPNQIINIGSGKAQNFREMIEFVIKETSSKSQIVSVDAPKFHKIVQVKDMYMDITKLKELGFKQEIDIFDGIKTLL